MTYWELRLYSGKGPCIPPLLLYSSLKESADVLGKVGLGVVPVWQFLWSDMDLREDKLFQ